MLIEDERGELRIRDASVLSNSTVSGGDLHMLPMVVPAAPASVEHDRFIPQRNNRGANATLNFEAKELLFAKKQFNCTHSANEQCDCLEQNHLG